jgi:hypothetical protein
MLSYTTLISQTQIKYNSLSNTYGSIGTLDAALFNNNDIEGSPFLFDSWNNFASIYINNKKKIDLQNINFNTQNSTFISKISKDSIFTFYYIDKVIINDRVFIQINNKFYENIASFNNSSLLKAYSLEIVPEKHKITNTIIGPGKYEIKSEYFLNYNGNLEKFKLRKKDILNKSNSRKNIVIRYVKNNKLSFSKEEDVIKIFNFLDKTDEGI